MNLESGLAYLSAALGGILALGAAIRAGRAIDRWAFVLGMTVLTVEAVCSGLMGGSPSPNGMYQWQMLRLTAAAFLPGVWLLFSLTFARGNARDFLREWRFVFLFVTLLPIGAVVFFRPGLIVATQQIDSLTHLIYRLGGAGMVLFLIQLITAVLVLMNLERTFRAAVGTVRWRIKFMLLGVGMLFLVQLYTASQALLFRGIDSNLDVLNSGTLIVACLLILRSLFRAGHFGLDVYPSHSVLQGSLTILLVGVYLLIVGVFAKVVAYLGGDSSFALKTLVVLLLMVLLAVLLQSDRVRLHLRRLISRHFQRPLYDYRTVWAKFTEGTASRVEPMEFSRAVVKLLAEIFQALSVTLWQVDEQREELTLAASSSLSGAKASAIKPSAIEAAAIIQQLRAHPEPMEVEKVTADWAMAVRRCHPGEFHEGGGRVCVPIVTGGEVLAVIMLGDRVSGADFTVQDLDLLKSIGEHVASGLLNVRLSQRLLQAREHEAFQTMAAFFVHDLKNAASTLNLMLQNLPDHFDDPAFREDALRGVGKSVAHINHLISRLSQLRHELKIAPVKCDLNELVAKTVAGFEPEADFKIVQDPGTLAAVLLDREQMSKVLTNLILNAREARSGPGSLRLSTRQAGSWVVLTAADDGSGMSPEFLTRSLFRPFQTTKKSGLGIGMFQSKMIVEAHGGRITVESTAGHGTTFRVFLPIGPT